MSITLTFSSNCAPLSPLNNSGCTSSSLNASDRLSSNSVTTLPSCLRSSLPLYNTTNSGAGIFISFLLYILSASIIFSYSLAIYIRNLNGIFSLIVDWCSTNTTNLPFIVKATSFFLGINNTSSRVTMSISDSSVYSVSNRLLYSPNASFLLLNNILNTVSLYFLFVVLFSVPPVVLSVVISFPNKFPSIIFISNHCVLALKLL